jgi:hypothetical protein
MKLCLIDDVIKTDSGFIDDAPQHRRCKHQQIRLGFRPPYDSAFNRALIDEILARTNQFDRFKVRKYPDPFAQPPI